MTTNSEKTVSTQDDSIIKDENLKEALLIIEDLMFTHEVTTVKEALATMLLGWVSTPLPLDPEERLNMVIYYEFLQEHLSIVHGLKQKVLVESQNDAL